MNIVLLDSATLPVPLTAPAWAGEWSARLATRAADVVHRLTTWPRGGCNGTRFRLLTGM
jgi:hypothetical protein